MGDAVVTLTLGSSPVAGPFSPVAILLSSGFWNHYSITQSVAQKRNGQAHTEKTTESSLTI